MSEFTQKAPGPVEKMFGNFSVRDDGIRERVYSVYFEKQPKGYGLFEITSNPSNLICTGMNYDKAILIAKSLNEGYALTLFLV